MNDYLIPQDSPIDRFIHSLRLELGDDRTALALSRAVLAGLKKRQSVDDVRVGLGMLLTMPAIKLEKGYQGIHDAWGTATEPCDAEYADDLQALRKMMGEIVEARVRWGEWIEDMGE